jgi:hypothetical protein
MWPHGSPFPTRSTVGGLLLSSAGWAGSPALRSELIAANFASPVFVAAPAGDPRLFVVERAGRIRIVEDGAVLPDPFLDISAQVSTVDAFGMFGLAFDPDYAATGLFYTYYINLAGESVISRFRVGTDPNVAPASSEQVVFSLVQPHSDHNGGTIAFSPHDGFLYFSPGDGGGGPYDPDETSQDPQQLLGKMLRLDVGGVGMPAGVPPTNPFVGDPGVRDEIWAFGLRNPFRFSFDRATGDLWIADVGQENREEILYEPAGDPGGRNYGWDIMEGTLCVAAIGWDPSAAFACNAPELALPLGQYDHGAGDCSITGGYVYRGSIPEIQGLYFYGDYCSARVWSFDRLAPATVDRSPELEPPGPPTLDEIVGFGEDGFGELYIVDLGGEVFRVRSTAPDGDDDVVPDAVDNCAGTPNPAQADTDGDGAGDACDADDDGDGDGAGDADDCRPFDDQLWAIPGEVDGLRAAGDPPGVATTLEWNPPAVPGGATVAYDTVVSEVADDFTAPLAQCIESGDGGDTQALDPSAPPPGSTRFFLVRAVNACGPGPAGSGAAGRHELRDCP